MRKQRRNFQRLLWGCHFPCSGCEVYVLRYRPTGRWEEDQRMPPSKPQREQTVGGLLTSYLRIVVRRALLRWGPTVVNRFHFLRIADALLRRLWENAQSLLLKLPATLD